MAKMRAYLLVVAVVALALVIAGCPKPAEDTSVPPVTGAGPPGGAGGGAAPDETTDTEEPGDTGAALDADAVKNFMACMDDDAIEKIMDETVDGLGVEDEDSPEAIKAALEEAAKNKDLDAAVQAYGFDSAAEWADTAKRVLPAMGAAMSEIMGELSKGRGIEEGTPAYDEMMAEAGEEFAEMEKAFGKPSDEDVAVVTEVLQKQMEEQMGGEGTD